MMYSSPHCIVNSVSEDEELLGFSEHQLAGFPDCRQQFINSTFDSVGSTISDHLPLESVATTSSSPSCCFHEGEGEEEDNDGMKEEDLELEVFGGGGGDFDSEIDIEQIEMH